MSDSLRPRGLKPTKLLCPWDFPGKNTGVGCHFLLWGVFPTQGSNPGLLHWQVDSLLHSHQGSPTEAIELSSMNVHILALFPHLCFLPWLFLSSSTLYPKHPRLSLCWKLRLKCPVFFLPYSKACITLKLLFMEPSEFLIMLQLFLFLNPYLLGQVT